jgi:nucleoside-diphosphate-sugar epimerase
MRVVLLGAAGFVGSQIAASAAQLPNVELVPVIRGQSWDGACEGADVVIHCANPAGRFRANSEPERDFVESVEQTCKLARLRKPGARWVLVSSISCRTQLDTVYGRHRRACECLALAASNTLVVRLGPMYGGHRTRDTLHDLVASRPIFVSAQTRYAYSPVAWSAAQVLHHAISSRCGLVEVGARNAIVLSELARSVGSDSEFNGPVDDQIPLDCPDGPDANDVVPFAQTLIGAGQAKGPK